MYLFAHNNKFVYLIFIIMLNLYYVLVVVSFINNCLTKIKQKTVINFVFDKTIDVFISVKEVKFCVDILVLFMVMF